MISSPRIFSTAVALAIACLVSAMVYYYKARTDINELMVFCKLHLNAFNMFDKLMRYVDDAKKSVNVCMPDIHNPAIQDRLITLLNNKNIQMRILLDRGFDSSNFLLRELVDAGAQVKCFKNQESSKIKFCLVDDEILMTGTLHWGMDDSDNWNYVYVTNKSTLVKPIKLMFYEIWKDLSTAVVVDTPVSSSVEESNEDIPNEEASAANISHEEEGADISDFFD